MHMRHIFLDTETTGLDVEKGHRLIEVGAIEYINRKPTGRQFHYLLNPEREVDPGAAHVHGYTWADLKNKPVFASIADEFMEFVKDGELIAHNADFDSGFLVSELERMNHPLSLFDQVKEIHNSVTLFRKLDPGHRSYSLDNVRTRWGLSNEGRELHGALLDCELLAEVFYKIESNAEHKIFDYNNLPDRRPVQRISADPARPLRVAQVPQEELASHREYLQRLRPEEASATPRSASRRSP